MGRGVALIPQLGDWTFEIKQKMMLATALRLRGWSTVVLADSFKSRWVLRYSRAFAITSFFYYDSLQLTKDEEEICSQVATNLLASELTFRSVKDWQFRGSWIGPQLLSSISRSTLRGAPDATSHEFRQEVSHLLPYVLHNVMKAEKLIQLIRPRLVVVNEANYATYGPIVDMSVRHGSDVIQYTQPWRDDALMCKRLTVDSRRLHPSSIDQRTLRQLARQPWTKNEDTELQQAFTDRYTGKWFLQRRNQADLGGPTLHKPGFPLPLEVDCQTAVVFSHVLWDANLFYGDDLFDDYADWFVETVRAACANSALAWFIKIHPANVWKRAYDRITTEYSELQLIRAYVGHLPNHVRLLWPESGISSLDLYRNADFGVTVRGTPGMEMACFGKPVLTAGTGRYSGMGFTIDSDSREEYLTRLRTIQDLPPLAPDQTLMAKRHAHAVFIRRPWEVKSFKCKFQYSKTGSKVLDHNLVPTVRSIDEIRANGDLEKWVLWAEQEDLLDYLG